MELRNFKQDPQSGDWISLRAVPLTTVVRMLNEAPTIDAVSVVRCENCKHWQSDGGAMMVCEHTDIPTDACDFCSWAEREGE